MVKLAERFGREVRARRKARGLTQAELAEAASLSEDWLSRLERGTGAPSFEALDALASALGVSVVDFFNPMSPRDVRLAKLDGMLSILDDADLEWVEKLVKLALARPRS